MSRIGGPCNILCSTGGQQEDTILKSNPNDFLKDKWRQAFYFLDVTKDGVLDVEDYETVADYIARETNASEEQACTLRDEWTKWPRLVLETNPAVINEERFLAAAQEMYQNVEEYKRQLRQTASELFDRLDFNKNGVISIQEFEVYYKAHRLNDLADMNKAFTDIDKDGDGFIKREELIEDTVRFFTDPDPVTGQAYICFYPKEKYSKKS